MVDKIARQFKRANEHVVVFQFNSTQHMQAFRKDVANLIMSLEGNTKKRTMEVVVQKDLLYKVVAQAGKHKADLLTIDGETS